MAVPGEVREPRKQQRISCRSHQIPDGIALLQQAGEKSAIFLRQRLEHQRRAHAPLAAHRDAKQRPQDEQRVHRSGKSARQFQQRVARDIEHQRRTPPKPVGHHAKDESADRAKHERDRNRRSDIRPRHAEIRRDRRNTENQNKKVECVERPPQKARCKRMTLPRIQAPEGAGHCASLPEALLPSIWVSDACPQAVEW